MWQSEQPARTPVRLEKWTLSLYSGSVKVCIEWQALPQNSTLPVAWTMTCVPMTLVAPTARPISSSTATGSLADGENSQRKKRLSAPMFLLPLRSTSRTLRAEPHPGVVFGQTTTSLRPWPSILPQKPRRGHRGLAGVTGSVTMRGCCCCRPRWHDARPRCPG